MKYLVYIILFVVVLISGCAKQKEEFKVKTEQFADLQILRYQVPGFEKLDLKQKKLLYYLYQAALSGRDIIYDQNYKYNLLIRHTLEGILNSYSGDKTTDDYQKLLVYTKRVWFSNGIHHHYSTAKFLPEFSKDYFAELIKNTPSEKLPLLNGQTKDDLLAKLTPIMFDPNMDSKRVNLDPNVDLVVRSANNFYEGVTQKEVEAYYKRVIKKNDPRPISYGLNSKMVFENGKIVEKVWKVGGMYTQAIEKIVGWLEKASTVSEDAQQKAALDKLIEFYKTGDLHVFNDYNIAWVQDTASSVDVVNGFIEVYGDAMGYRGSYESVVSFKDLEATKRIAAISKEAQWFEDHSPIMDEQKKKKVTGISAKVITVVVESGDSSPATPIGINLPNANWIRSQYGSKSVSLGNIIHSYNEASKTDGALEEFAYSQQEIDLAEKYGTLSSDLATDMHEVIGHASGQINAGVGTPKETLKNYASTLEEARADLVALYYIMDKKLVDIGVMPSLDVGKVQYNSYIRNGLLQQLRRLKLGDNLEEAHMRNRQLIAKWAFEKGAPDHVIEKKVRDGKTYFVINDYDKLRALFGQLLKEIQRIKSEGDYEAGKNLVETYGVKVDSALQKEVLQRYATLHIAPYSGFINPKLGPVMQDGEIVDVKIEYPDDFMTQMLEYGKEYSFLPVEN